MKHLFFENALYREIAYTVFSALAIIAIPVLIKKKNSLKTQAAWANIKSWVFTSLILFIFMGFGNLFTICFFGLTAILASKYFFQITGMYHRNNFVWITYIFLILLVYCIYNDHTKLYLSLPMIFFATICLVPIWRNSYSKMVQYLSLTLVNFSFMWGFLHLGLITKLDGGLYMAFFLILITEFFDHMYLIFSRPTNRYKIVSNITSKRSFEGFSISIVLTFLLAYFIRNWLPGSINNYWWCFVLLTIFCSSLGNLVMTVIRRDLDIKITGPFIIGRSDFLSLIDRIIFVAPIFYYFVIIAKG